MFGQGGSFLTENVCSLQKTVVNPSSFQLSFSRLPRQPNSLRSFPLQRPLRMSTFAAFRLPNITNEPNQHYEKGGKSREGLEAAVKALQEKAPLDIPNCGDQERRVNRQHPLCSHKTTRPPMPRPIAKYSNASANRRQEVQSMLLLQRSPRGSLCRLPTELRSFSRAADLISTKYRYEIMAATMLGQGQKCVAGRDRCGRRVDRLSEVQCSICGRAVCSAARPTTLLECGIESSIDRWKVSSTLSHHSTLRLSEEICLVLLL